MTIQIAIKVSSVAAILCVLNAQQGLTRISDCQEGTAEVSWDTFFSNEYAGRLAIATDATTPDEAKDADSYCVLTSSLFGSVAKVRKRYDRIYFVFNNRPAVSPENAEVSFIGIQVKAKSDSGEAVVAMRREGGNWVDRPIDRKYKGRQFSRSGKDVQVVAQAHARTQLASRGYPLGGLFGANGVLSEEAFAGEVKASVHGAVKPRDDTELKQTWDYRDRMTFVGSQFDGADPPNNVTAIWISFAQRTARFSTALRRVATGVRVGDAPEMDVTLFGSNAEIPEYRYKVIFFK